jgi:hypothetical protein
MDDNSYGDFDSAFLPDGQDAAQEDAYYDFSQGSKQVSDGDGSNDEDSTSESDSSSESESEGESDRSIEEKGPKRRKNLSRERRGRDLDEEVEEDTRAKRSKSDQPSISAMNLFVRDDREVRIQTLLVIGDRPVSFDRARSPTESIFRL